MRLSADDFTMRIKIQPLSGPLEAVHYMSVDSLRLVARSIVCEVAFWGESGRCIDRRDVPFTAEDYAAWCETDIDSDDMEFAVGVMVARYGLTVIPPPPPPPPAPPETEEERIAREAAEAAAAVAQKAQDIADLIAQIATLQAQLAALDV